MAAGSKMHQTTVRFGRDLWETLEAEAAAAGVSVAHYVREAALARVAYAAGLREHAELEPALAAAQESPVAEAGTGRADLARSRARDAIDSSKAVQSQSEHVRGRSKRERERMADYRTGRG